jgi:hypothetical protein
MYKDNGCVTMTNVTIISDPLPGLTVAVDNQCSGSGSTFTITAPTAASLTPLTGIGGPTGTFQTSQHLAYQPVRIPFLSKIKMVV